MPIKYLMKPKLLLILIFLTSNVLAQDKSNPKLSSPKPFVLGQIHEIYSNILNENRILNIYLPEGYNSKDTIKYPVIYLLDGSADEDFIHVVGLVQFNSFEWINTLAKSIVVGIATVDRKRDYTFPTSILEEQIQYPGAGHAEQFIAFIETELQPYVDKTLQTNKSKTLIGQSLGGLLAAQILLKKPYLFNQYVIVSPSLWWDNASILSQNNIALNRNFNKPLNIYIAVGKEGLTPTKNPRVMEVDANLLAEKLIENKNEKINVYFDYLPEKNHANILHQAIDNAFNYFHKVNNH